MIYDLNAKLRQPEEKAKDLLAKEIIPGVVYGPEVKENILIAIDRVTLEKLYRGARENSLVNLTIEGEKEARETLIKELQYNPLISRPIHVDFYQIKKGEKLDIEARLEFVGIAPAVKELGGILVKNMSSVAIRCLARDMVSVIKVDISNLKTFDDKISVRDLPIPANVEVLENLDESVAVVTSIEEEKDVPVVVAEPEVVGKEKKEAGDEAVEPEKK